MARSRIRIGKDRVDEFKRRVASIGESSVRVGVLGEKASAMADGGPMTVGQVAVVHEFGTSRIPKRSFLREPIDRTREELDARMTALLMQVASGELELRQALDQIGLSLSASLADGIRKGLPVPPLKPETVRKRMRKDGKTSSTPLFNTGQLANSISHQIVKRNEAE